MEDAKTPPWLSHPELSKTRLTALAEQLAAVWNDCLTDHDPDKGDDGWVIGCRFFRRGCHHIKDLAGSPSFSWLTVMDPSFHFVFGMGGVPVRFFHGDEERKNPRTGQVYGAELEARNKQLVLFPAFFKNDPMAWRMMVVTDYSEGPVLRVVMVRVDPAGEIHDPWTIPLTPKVVPFASVTVAPKPGVALPPPQVGPKKPATKIQESGSDDDGEA